ncbi:MAG: RagB/SusD family nutrient uptake outer membrane protein [Cyclobacteriaceae bacterium]|nr:RagB/SusD family nutrient uptake outer membrane protein [Cyclobacteriaceae bacterium]
MKTINKINIRSGFMALMLVTLWACDGKLDIEPQQSISTDVALNSSENVINVLIGSYSEAGGQFGIASDGRPEGGELYGGDFNLFSELMGSDGEITWNGSFDTYEDIFDRDMISNHLLARNNWMRAYNSINIINNVIANIDIVDQALKDQALGEALFMRGVMHFELVRFYALPYEPGGANLQVGVPIVTSATDAIDESTQLSRATVAEVYTQVIADLTDAESLMNSRNGSFANRHAAAAMLSRVYLQQGDYAAAADAANRVIDQGGYTLVPDYASAFNNAANSIEDIFAVQQNTTFNAGTSNSGLPTFYANLVGVGRDGDIDVLPAHLDLYEAGDARLDLFYTGIDGLPKTGKWAVDGANIPVVRLAEMYLTRAEANFRAGTAVGADPLDDINLIRGRVGLTALAVLTLDDIMVERRKELAFEGQRLHDLKRTQQTVSGSPYNADELVFPIPQREIDVNSNLEQNPGY